MEDNDSTNLPLVENNGTIANSREELEKALCEYMLNTKYLMDTATHFFAGLSKWKTEREKEINDMKDIKESPNKSLWNWFSPDRETLGEKLTALLQSTQIGLEMLVCFLEDVEMLAVTSLYIFEVIQASTGINLEPVLATITAARLACPLLIMFKRDHKAFFHPSLDNMEVMIFQLEKYISITQTISSIFKGMEENLISGFWQMNQEITAQLAEDLSKDEIESFLSHINQLVCIRMDKDFRLVFLFQNMSTSYFTDEFSQRKPTMMKFLDELEEIAVQLDRLKKGVQISSVAGSSVGAVGGIVSIAGLVLIPFTAGASAWLAMAGMGLGATSVVNSAVTTGTEIMVSRNENQKASEKFQNFMEAVKVLQDYLELVSCQTIGEDELEKAKEGFVLNNNCTAGKSIDYIIDFVPTMKAAIDNVDIDNVAVYNAAIDNAAVGNAAVDNAAVDNAAIGTAAVDNAAVGNAAVGNAAIGTAAVDNAAVDNAAVGTAAVGTAAVDNAAVDNAAVGNAAVGNAAIGTAAVDNAAVGNAAIDNAAVDNAAVGNAAVGNAAVGTAAVGNAAVGNAAVGNAAIGNAAVGNAAVDNAAVDNAAVGTAAVDNAAIGNAAVDNAAVDNAAIGNAAVDNAAVGNAAVDNAAVGTAAVGTAAFYKAADNARKILGMLPSKAMPSVPKLGFHPRLPHCHGYNIARLGHGHKIARLGHGHKIARLGHGQKLARAALDIPDIGQAAAKGAAALPKAARAGLIAFNGLFLGLDLFYIYKDSVNLAQGSKCDHALLIRSRAALWRSEVDSMQKIHDSLCKGVQEADQKIHLLEMSFEPLENDT